LMTGHDCLQAHLHKIHVVPDDQCTLCGNGRMDTGHLYTFAALADVRAANQPHLTGWTQRANLYWAARRQMAEMPRVGAG
jgi:hypothetical protein